MCVYFRARRISPGVFCYEVIHLKELLENAKENLSFLLICILIALALVAVARIAEHFLPHKRKVSPTRRITLVAICGAIAMVLHLLDFPLLFLAPDFYKLDFSELPVLLCSFYLGPSAGVVCEGLKILLKLLVKGTSTAFVGDFANFVVGCTLVLPAAICYHVKKTKKTALLGLALGTVIMTVFGSLFNAVYLLPKFFVLFDLSLDQIVSMGSAINGQIHSVSTLVLFSVAPLNLLKAVVVSLLTLLLYKRVEKPLFEKVA